MKYCNAMKYLVLMMISTLLAAGVCHAKEPHIEQVRYELYGGRIQLSEALSIAPYFILYSYSSRLSSEKPRRMEAVVEDSCWHKLLAAFKLETFKKIKEFGSAGDLGIPDKKVTITMSDGEKFSIVNPIKDEHYESISGFFAQLDSLRNEYNKSSKP